MLYKIQVVGRRLQLLGFCTTSGTDSNLEIGDGSTIFWRFGRNSSNHFNVDWTSGNSLMFAGNSGGNVGIGNLAPQNRLDVSGAVAVGTFAGVDTAPSNGAIISGQVGIGTTTVNDKVDIEGAFIVKNSSAPASMIRLVNADGANFIQSGTGYASDTRAPLIISSMFAGNEWARFNTSGNLGLATASPQNRLDVSGAVAVGSYAGVDTGPSNGMIVSGQVAIGTSSAISNTMLTVEASTYAAAFFGGFCMNYSSTGGNYDMSAENTILGITNTASARTVNLPSPVTNAGWLSIIQDLSGNSGTTGITIDGNGSSINGSSSTDIITNYGSKIIYSNGTQYYML